MDYKKKIIFINQYTGYLFIDIINAFADKYQCELYTGKIDLLQTKLAQSVKVKRLIPYNRNKTATRVFTWAFFSLQTFFKLLFIKKRTELFVVTNPPSAPFLGYFFNRVRGARYHLLIYDVYPNVLVNFKIIKARGLIDKIWSKFNSKIFKGADSIFTLSDGMANLIKVYAPQANVVVIPNWADTAYIKPIEKLLNPFAIQYDQVNKLTVMYAGNMGATHAIEKVAELTLIFKNNQSWDFILIGDGVKKNMIRDLKEKNSLDNLILLDYQPTNILPYALACADVGIVTLSLGAEDLSVPSKTYNLLAAGVILLVIAPDKSELTKLVNHYKCGRQFEENKTEEMAAFLSELESDYGLFLEMKTNARKASADFTTENATLYTTLLNSNLNVS